ncbi:MAG: DNA alkylation repair protein [Nanoarchaeota archaeon]|nr:DNA alkylation repair protein [Nanoarchaeota archaeon]
MKTLKKDLRKQSDKDRVRISQSFFKTERGQYGEGDIFLGVTVPKQRLIAKEAAKRISLEDIQKLLSSKIHEERFISLLLLIERYKKANEEERKSIFSFYINNAKKINNWDLVDVSAPKIIGRYLLEKKDRIILFKLSKSENLWEKRIAIVSTFEFIRKNQFNETLEISKILLKDKHDLIHKAVGWMLREIGKRDRKSLEKFLSENYGNLPRTTLRYAIERFPEDLRQKFLKGNI